MRTFTKSLVTLLLLFVAGSISAQSLKVLNPNGERDWSQQTDGDYPYYFADGWFPAGAYKEVVDGALHIYNEEAQGQNYQLQLFILDWFNLTQGENYVIRIWMKADGEGTANLTVGTWDASATSTFSFEESDEFKMYQIAHTAGVTSTGNNVHILFQSGTFVGNIYIQKVQVLQMGEDKPTLSTYGTWKPLINNGDLEGDDNTSFWTKIWVDPSAEGLTEEQEKAEKTANSSPILNSEIVDGEGYNGTRGLKMTTKDFVRQVWDNQFWIRSNQPLKKNDIYRIKFDYRADISGEVSTQIHREPADWAGNWLGSNMQFTNDWQTYSNFDSPTTVGTEFQSLTFNLSEIHDANTYYFDNFSFDLYEPQIDVQYSENASIQILFPYYVNTCRLLLQHAGGKRRLLLPNETFTVTINGKTAELLSVEIDATGALMIFIDEDWAADNDCDYVGEDDEITVTLNNPEGDFHLFNIDTNETVENFTLKGRYNQELDIMPFTYAAPEMMSSDPEEGSFNLPSTISEFKFTFDKKVIVNKLDAKLDNEKLTAEAEDEFSAEVTLKRTSDKALADGEHKITITNIFAEQNLGENDYNSCEVNFSTGVQVSQDLKDAITAAQTVLDNNSDPRYAGDAYTALESAITKYSEEVASYTAPSVIDAAVIDLNTLSKTLSTHRTLVDDYDAVNQKIQDLATGLAESKFNTTDLYLQLKALAEKYAGKELTNDEELTAANVELKPMASLCGEMFTSGESSLGNAGYKVLTERLRLGAETMKALGWAEDDPLIVAADNATKDDDDIAAQMMLAIKIKLYDELKNPENDFFPVVDSYFDEDAGEEVEVTKSYDMSVFVKNPNIYAFQQKDGFSEDNVPGWTNPGGGAGLYANTTWQGEREIDGLPEDCAFTTYYGTVRMENNSIDNLPAGVYNIQFWACDWLNRANADDPVVVNGYVFAKTTQELEEEAEGSGEEFAAQEPIIGGSGFNQVIEIKDITVTDGKLVIGAQYAGDSQYFFHKIRLLINNTATDFDYKKAYDELVTNINKPETETAKVRALQLYDLNGRRIVTAQKGIQIVKKMMSDGTVKTQKVIK